MTGLLRALLTGRTTTGRTTTGRGGEALPRKVIWRLWSDQHLRAPRNRMSCGCTRNQLTRRLTSISGSCPRHFDLS